MLKPCCKKSEGYASIAFKESEYSPIAFFKKRFHSPRSPSADGSESSSSDRLAGKPYFVAVIEKREKKESGVEEISNHFLKRWKDR